MTKDYSQADRARHGGHKLIFCSQKNHLLIFDVLWFLLWLDSHLSALLISFNSWLFTSQHLHGHATYDVHPIDNDSSACMMIFWCITCICMWHLMLYYYTRVIVVKCTQQQPHIQRTNASRNSCNFYRRKWAHFLRSSNSNFIIMFTHMLKISSVIQVWHHLALFSTSLWCLSLPRLIHCLLVINLYFFLRPCRNIFESCIHSRDFLLLSLIILRFIFLFDTISVH